VLQYPTNALIHRPVLLNYIKDGRIKVPSARAAMLNRTF